MVLVSILGDFHSSILPIFFEFKEKLTHHIIIHDDSKYDMNQANKLIQAQKDFISLYKDDKDINFELIDITIDEDDYEDIIKTYEKIKSLTNKNNIYLNATDGLNSVGIVLSNKFLDLGSNVIVYDKFSNTYNLHKQNSINRIKIKNNTDIKNHLRLKGYSLLDYSNKFELQNRKDDILRLCENLTELKELGSKLQESKLNNVSGYEKYKKILKKLNQSNNVSFIQGTVFEEYIYWIIKDNFDFDDVMVGLKIEFEKDFENELDIVMIKDNHLHTIECKFVNYIKGEHFVYKTNSIIDYLDDDGKAMILSIGGDNTKITNSGNKKLQFTIGDQARASNGNIKIHQNKTFKKSKFIEDVKKHFLAN